MKSLFRWLMWWLAKYLPVLSTLLWRHMNVIACQFTYNPNVFRTLRMITKYHQSTILLAILWRTHQSLSIALQRSLIWKPFPCYDTIMARISLLQFAATYDICVHSEIHQIHFGFSQGITACAKCCGRPVGIINCQRILCKMGRDDASISTFREIARKFIMTSWHGNTYCITDLLWGNPPAPGRFPPKGSVMQSFVLFFVVGERRLLPMTWHVLMLMWCHLKLSFVI